MPGTQVSLSNDEWHDYSRWHKIVTENGMMWMLMISVVNEVMNLSQPAPCGFFVVYPQSICSSRVCAVDGSDGLKSIRGALIVTFSPASIITVPSDLIET